MENTLYYVIRAAYIGASLIVLFGGALAISLLLSLVVPDPGALYVLSALAGWAWGLVVTLVATAGWFEFFG